MKVRFTKTTWRAVGTICASLVLVVSFQNCGKAGFDSSLDESLDSASLDAALTSKYGSTMAARVTNIPFAFDGGFDQIAYNSCAESGSITSSTAYYSVKAGAYQNYGLRLKDEFFNYVTKDNGFNPIYPATTISASQYKEWLADSPANINATMTAAIRDKTNLTSIYSSSNSLALYTDVIPMIDTLTSTYVMQTLMADRGSASRYFPFSSNFRVMEANLKFNSDQSMSNSLREILRNTGQLALTYMNDTTQINSVMAAATASPQRLAYGKGYRFTFQQPPGVSNTYMQENIVSAIQEVDLSTGSVVNAGWNCARIYRIVLVRDSTNSSSGGYCPPMTAAELDNASNRTELEIVRRQFRSDQWDVNVPRRCMVPKGTTPACYTENTVNGVAQGVEYSTSATCYNPLLGNNPSNYPSTTIPAARCLNYATICTRGF
ncbi:MAG: hypothetical protein J7501_01250 [Bdellovibrio sp.]|nr:hypothetical protein [Bdellovibrio sp.]